MWFFLCVYVCVHMCDPQECVWSSYFTINKSRIHELSDKISAKSTFSPSVFSSNIIIYLFTHSTDLDSENQLFQLPANWTLVTITYKIICCCLFNVINILGVFNTVICKINFCQKLVMISFSLLPFLPYLFSFWMYLSLPWQLNCSNTT